MKMKPIVPFEPVRRDEIPDGEWISQIKWDGVRVLTYYDGEQVRLFNRKKNERTHHYPEITDIHAYCNAKSVILDGEVIALGEDGKPSFHEVMRRDGIRRMDKVEYVQKAVPVSYMIFDILYHNGEWVTKRPLSERSELLSSIIEPNEQIQTVKSHDDPERLFEVIQGQGMEGIVIKDPDAPYLIGEKKENWIKVKNYRDLIAVIGGFTLSGGVINAILLGLYDNEGNFHYIGHTGTGKMTKQEWRDLTEKLKPEVMEDRPFVNPPERHKDAYWVKPEHTVKIMYAEWTSGRALRQPSIQSFVDVPAEQCILTTDMFK